jgi:hypothetical protein
MVGAREFRPLESSSHISNFSMIIKKTHFDFRKDKYLFHSTPTVETVIRTTGNDWQTSKTVG